MTSTCLPQPIPLQRPHLYRAFEIVLERLTELHHRWQAWRAVRAEWRRSAEAERALARLSPETLRDIGAPQGLIGQRRWQEEQEATQVLRILHMHGW
jgi:hypothetical protein